MASKQERLLLLRRLFLEETDENHYIKMEDIEKRLQADRRTIEQDIDNLIQSGMDIEKKPRPKLAYAVLSRDFTLEEIKLLLDCVQVSKFLSEKKTEELTKKLCALFSRHEAAQLSGQVHRNHIKSGNEGVYLYIDMIHRAIAEKLLLTFQYTEYLPTKQKRARHDGKIYVVCPVALIYAEENYYLLATEVESTSFSYSKIKHFRVDRMEKVNTTDNYDNMESKSIHVRVNHYARRWNIEDYTKQNFSMYGGKVERVTMQFPNYLAEVVFDRFGMDVHITQTSKEHFQITESIAVSPQFFGWVFGLGKEVKIIEPKHVAQEMKDLLKDTYAVYTLHRNRKKKLESSQ